MYLRAMRTASMVVSTTSDGVEQAMTGSGDSPCRPKRENSKSVCSGLVGIPVEGPARWTFTTRSGNSAVSAKLIASLFRAIPGPDDPVTARLPPKDAPMAAPTAAISSSAWKVLTPRRLCRESSWRMSEAGVMG